MLLATTFNNLTTNGFRLNPNGTLRIQHSSQAPGVYRCLANETRFGIGATLSNNVIVSTAGMSSAFSRIFLNYENVIVRNNLSYFLQLALTRVVSSANSNQTIFAGIGESIVLNCPFRSHPEANFSWYVNQSTIFNNEISDTPTDTQGVTSLDNRRVKVFGF